MFLPTIRRTQLATLIVLAVASLTSASTPPAPDSPSPIVPVTTAQRPAEDRFQQALVLLRSSAAKDRSQARKLLREAAQAGNGAACRHLGKLLWEDARKNPKALAEARRWFEKGAAANDVPSILGLAQIVEREGPYGTSCGEATTLYERALTLDPCNAFAHEKLADLVSWRAKTQGFTKAKDQSQGPTYDYRAPKRTEADRERDRAEEFFHLTEASRLGSGRAAFQLACRARTGVDGAPDPARARTLADLGAKRGYAYGHRLCAEMSEKGEGGPVDLPSAAARYQLAAEGGDSDSAIKLAEFYRYGLGVPRDLARAIHWLTVADAAYRFSVASTFVELQLDRSEIKDALARLEKMTKSRDPQQVAFAWEHLSRCYESGNGVTRDAERATDYLAKAAKYGSAEALFRLAQQDLANGRIEEGIRRLKIATEVGRTTELIHNGNGFNIDSPPSPAACFALGRMYLIGEHVPKDDTRGWSLVGEAVHRHNLDALCFAAQATAAGTAGAPSCETAIRFATEAEACGATVATAVRVQLEQLARQSKADKHD